MAKKATNKKANIKDTVLDVEKTENVENTALDTENTILDVEKKDSDIIRKALEGDASNVINEDEQKPTEDNAEIDTTTIYEKISESAKIGKGQDNKQNSANKVNKTKRKISKLFGYYWNGQMMD